MDIANPAGVAAVGGVSAIVVGPAQEFLRKIFGPAAGEIGDMFLDRVRAYRYRNVEKNSARAEAMLATTGRPAGEVPLRTLIPLIEGASREDDPSLSELWAALLANAADTGGTEIGPMFPTILSQLSPGEARLLSELLTLEERGLRPDDLPEGETRATERWGVRRSELLASSANVTPEDVEVCIDTVVALGLVAHEPPIRPNWSDLTITTTKELRLTYLGRRFLRACTAPLPLSPVGE